MVVGGHEEAARLDVGRALAYSIAGGLFIVAIAETWIGITAYHWADHLGVDLSIYLGATDRLLHGQGWFLERQLGGPYEVQMGDVLYPPSAAILFAPFLLAPALWWSAVPILAWLVWRSKPQPWEWALYAACLAFPLTPARILTGNPAMWLAVFVAIPRLSGLVLLKPSLAPFALRSSWHVPVGLLLLTLPGLVTYASVLLNARAPGLYAFFDVPLMVIAWRSASSR